MQVFITHNIVYLFICDGEWNPKEKATSAKGGRGEALINLKDTLIISAYHKIIKEVRR